MKNRKDIESVMKEMKENIIKDNPHEVLDLWYELEYLLNEENEISDAK